MQTQQTAEQRAAQRFATDLDADCRMAGESWSARLRNISTTGCMIACPEAGLPEGWMMRLRIRSLPAIDAEIVWRHRGHAGLRFLAPLQPNAMEHHGVRRPEPARREPPPRPHHAGALEASLHARLVKRLPPGEQVVAFPDTSARGLTR
jgi:hypothetical protein